MSEAIRAHNSALSRHRTQANQFWDLTGTTNVVWDLKTKTQHNKKLIFQESKNSVTKEEPKRFFFLIDELGTFCKILSKEKKYISQFICVWCLGDYSLTTLLNEMRSKLRVTKIPLSNGTHVKCIRYGWSRWIINQGVGSSVMLLGVIWYQF